MHKAADRFPEELRYGFDMQGKGMKTFVMGMINNGVQAKVRDNVLIIDGMSLPDMTVVVRKGVNDETGFLVDVPSYNLVTYWPNRRGVYNWDKIIKRLRMACRIIKAARDRRSF